MLFVARQRELGVVLSDSYIAMLAGFQNSDVRDCFPNMEASKHGTWSAGLYQPWANGNKHDLWIHESVDSEHWDLDARG